MHTFERHNGSIGRAMQTNGLLPGRCSPTSRVVISALLLSEEAVLSRLPKRRGAQGEGAVSNSDLVALASVHELPPDSEV